MRQPGWLSFLVFRDMLIFQHILTLIKEGLHTSGWILRIVIPTSLIVSLLNYYGVIAIIAKMASPLFALIGLSGESSIVFITSLFLPLYAPIATMSQIALNLREVSILALMCLIAHSLPIESSVQRKISYPIHLSIPLRIIFSIAGGALLNAILPSELALRSATFFSTPEPVQSIKELLLQWGTDTISLSLKIIAIITGLMILQDILRRTGTIEKTAKMLSPLMKLMGLSPKSAFLWLTAQIVGLSYGAGIMHKEMKSYNTDRNEIRRLNHHIAVNHSLLEDTTLFTVMGVGWLYLVLPRLLFATIIVWCDRIITYLTNRKTASATTQRQ